MYCARRSLIRSRALLGGRLVSCVRRRRAAGFKSQRDGLEERKLSSSLILVGKEKTKTATRSKTGEKEEVKEAKAEEIGIEGREEKVTQVSKEVKN